MATAPQGEEGEDADVEDDLLEDVIRSERKRMRLKRSSNHVLGQQQSAAAVADQPNGPSVEFFNPKIRHELEKKDAEFMKRTGLKGAAPGGDAWVWLTSYSRIPVSSKEEEEEDKHMCYCGKELYVRGGCG